LRVIDNVTPGSCWRLRSVVPAAQNAIY